MKKRTNFIFGALAIILAATLWSLDGAVIRPNFYNFPAINIVFIEHLLGSLLLSPFLIKGWNKVKNINKKDLGALLWICFFGGLIGTLAITESYFAAYSGETTLATVVILQKLQPVFALFLAGILLKEKLTKTFYFWALVSIISAGFVAFGSIEGNIFDVNIFSTPSFYAVLAAFAFGSSTVFGKTLVDDLGFKLSASLRFTLTTFLALIAVIIFSKFNIYLNFEPIHWKLLLAITFFTGAGASFIYYFGLKRVKASQSTILELAFPISVVIFDYYFNGNVLNSTQIISSIILIIGFFMIINQRK